MAKFHLEKLRYCYNDYDFGVSQQKLNTWLKAALSLYGPYVMVPSLVETGFTLV